VFFDFDADEGHGQRLRWVGDLSHARTCRPD
jgi:hypothetical protein